MALNDITRTIGVTKHLPLSCSDHNPENTKMSNMLIRPHPSFQKWELNNSMNMMDPEFEALRLDGITLKMITGRLEA